MEDLLTPAGPYYELLLMEGEHPKDITGHVCNQCGVDVAEAPCPEHGPRDVPGLTLMDCDAEPRHWIWTPAGDYFPPPCYRCEWERLLQREWDRRDAPHKRRLHGYARSGWWWWMLRVGARLGLLHGLYGRGCPGGGWCHGARWRWSR